jgi:hypothetical protein
MPRKARITPTQLRALKEMGFEVQNLSRPRKAKTRKGKRDGGFGRDRGKSSEQRGTAAPSQPAKSHQCEVPGLHLRPSERSGDVAAASEGVRDPDVSAVGGAADLGWFVGDWPGAATHHLAKACPCPVCGAESHTFVQTLDGLRIGNPQCEACHEKQLPPRRRHGRAARERRERG